MAAIKNIIDSAKNRTILACGKKQKKTNDKHGLFCVRYCQDACNVYAGILVFKVLEVILRHFAPQGGTLHRWRVTFGVESTFRFPPSNFNVL